MLLAIVSQMLFMQLRCFIHFKRNVSEEYGIPTKVAEEFLSDIWHSGSTYNEGLVDSTSEKDFSERLEKCKAIWNAVCTLFSFTIKIRPEQRCEVIAQFNKA